MRAKALAEIACTGEPRFCGHFLGGPLLLLQKSGGFLDSRRDGGGYLRVCTEGRNWFEADLPNWLKEESPVISSALRSEEHGSCIIEALETGRPYRGHFNVVNRGHGSESGHQTETGRRLLDLRWGR